MNLASVYFVLISSLLLLITDSAQSIDQCPTSRRLLLFDTFKFPFGEKKSSRPTSSSPKHARARNAHSATVFIQPQTSQELGHKVHSYTHLLTPKLFTTAERMQLKQLRKAEKKKQIRKKESTKHAKSKELIPIDEEEMNRCRAVLQIDSVPTATTTTTTGLGNEKKTKKAKRGLPIKQQVSTKVKELTNQVAKNMKKKVENIPSILPVNDQTVKPTKKASKAEPKEKKPTKLSLPTTPSIVKASSKSPSPPTPPTSHLKLKRPKPETITIIERITSPFDSSDDEIDNQNNSVVNRAFYFVKNMFQLSDNSPDQNPIEEDQIIDMTNEPQLPHHHHSRKLLSIDEDLSISCFSTADSSIHFGYVPSRRLLTTKTKSTKKKEKKPKLASRIDANKPKVGWAYRYRISRYLAAQKMKRTVGTKHQQTKKTKKSPSSMNTKVSKRKLLQLDLDEEYSSDWETNDLSDRNIIETISISTDFVPKRQLLASKTKAKPAKHDDTAQPQKRKEKLKERQDILAFDELTDPIAIVHSYDQGLYKPHVGWQFRYRVSRYIDSLRESIREDQERLKLGLQAIKGQTPQELARRGKRAVDRPISSDAEPKERIVKEKKPDVGWDYRYRVSKMNEAKQRGESIEGEKEKQRTVLDPKRKPVDRSKTTVITESIQEDIDLDPELAKIKGEGRKVGWAYRYRIRRKLDHLKQIQTETGVPFDLPTLSGKREKKVKSTPPTKKNETTVEKAPEKNKSVGWQYRYRVSKMHEAQKLNKPQSISSKEQEDKPVAQKKLPPSEEKKAAGWEHRYRIRRKVDSAQGVPPAGQSKKRMKQSSKVKKQSQVPDSRARNAHSDRAPGTGLFATLLPTAKKALCIVPFAFCDSNSAEPVVSKKRKRVKKLRTKKEHRAKQFIRGHRTKLGAEDKATERRVDEQMKRLYRRPSYPPPQTPPAPPAGKIDNVSKKDHANEHAGKVIVVDSKKNQNKKQYQIIGQEKKIRAKGLSSPPKSTKPSKGEATSTVTKAPRTTTTTASPPLRTLSELIRDEATTILATKRKESQTPEEVKYEIDETKEIIQEQAKLHTTTTTTTAASVPDNPTTTEEQKESTSSNDDSNKNKQDEDDTENILNLER